MGDDRIEEIHSISQQKTTSHIGQILDKSGVQDSPTGFQTPDERHHLDDINQWQKFPMPPVHEERYVDNDDFQLGSCMVATGTERLSARGTAVCDTAVKTVEKGDSENVTAGRYFSVKTVPCRCHSSRAWVLERADREQDHGEYGQKWQSTVLSYPPTSPRAADGACASTTSTGERGAGGSSPSTVALVSLRDCESGCGEPIRADRISQLHFTPTVNCYQTKVRCCGGVRVATS